MVCIWKCCAEMHSHVPTCERVHAIPMVGCCRGCQSGYWGTLVRLYVVVQRYLQCASGAPHHVKCLLLTVVALIPVVMTGWNVGPRVAVRRGMKASMIVAGIQFPLIMILLVTGASLAGPRE